jgi:hypothetical protein
MNDVFRGNYFEVDYADDKAEVELNVGRNHDRKHIHMDDYLERVDHAPE